MGPYGPVGVLFFSPFITIFVRRTTVYNVDRIPENRTCIAGGFVDRLQQNEQQLRSVFPDPARRIRKQLNNRGGGALGAVRQRTKPLGTRPTAETVDETREQTPSN